MQISTVLCTCIFYINGIILHVACNFQSLIKSTFWRIYVNTYNFNSTLFTDVWMIWVYINAVFMLEFILGIYLEVEIESTYIYIYIHIHKIFLDVTKLFSKQFLIYLPTRGVWNFPLCYILINACHCCKYKIKI